MGDRAGTVVATIGGCGGAGASVLAAVLARAGRARLGPVLLVDGDPLGGGLGTLFAGRAPQSGRARVPGRAVDLSRVRGRLPAGALGATLPEVDGVHQLDVTRDRLAVTSVPAVLAAARAEAAVVVLDLPRSPTGASAALAATADAVLLVCPGHDAAARAARSVLAGLGAEAAAAVHLVARRPFALPPALLAGELGVPWLADLPDDRSVRRAVARGEPPGLARRSPLRVAAEALLRHVVDRAGGPAGPGAGLEDERERMIQALIAGTGPA